MAKDILLSRRYFLEKEIFLATLDILLERTRLSKFKKMKKI